MNECRKISSQFSAYLDSRVSGAAMQEIAAHLRGCAACTREFAAYRQTQSMLAALGPAKAPEDLALHLRIALSRERARTPRASLDRWQMHWQNTLRPLALRASAGMASAVFLIGSFALLIGMFATPEPVEARDVPLDGMSAAHFLYTAVEPEHAIGARENPLIVQAYVDASGKVYDYRILAGDADPQTRSDLESILLFSIFAPARSFDQPVRSTVVMAFSGVSVKG